MALSEAEQAKAETIVKGFFWQPGEIHRYRTLYFTEGASMQPDEIRLVREYLLGLGSLASLNVCGKLQEFPAAMKVLDVWWQTNPSDKWAGTESTKVRIYLALRPRHGENDADGPYTVENGCKYLVTHTFYWDVEALPTLPESSSGVNYTMQGVTRDRETGLFACVIERRETVQQDVAEYTKAETEFEREQEEQHLGVKESAVAATGRQAGAAYGVITMREVRKNPDCTSDVINRKRTELASPGATKEYQGDPRGTIETTIDRNQQSTVTGENLANGETRRSEKTEGKRYNNTRRVPTPKNAMIVETEQATSNESSSTRLTAHKAKPAVSPIVPEKNKEKRVSVRPNDLNGWDKEETTIEHRPATTGELTGGSPTVRKKTKHSINADLPQSAPGGKNHVKKFSATPNGHGSFTVAEEDEEYLPATTGVLNGGSVVAQTKSKVSINADLPQTAPGGVNVEKQVSAIPNEHGSFTVHENETVHQPATTGPLSGGSADEQVVVEIGINQVQVPGASPAVNVTEEVSANPNNHGSFTVHKRRVVHKRRSVQSISEMPTLRTVKTVTINDTEVPRSAEASATPNNHGSATTQKTEYVPIAIDSGWIRWDREQKMVRATYKYHCGMRIFRNLDRPPDPPSGKNCVVHAAINQFGKFDGTMTYEDLYEYTVAGGDNGSPGGSSEGTMTAEIFNPETGSMETKQFSVRTYFGTGNEGSEATTRANARLYHGIHLPPRTYILSVVA